MIIEQSISPKKRGHKSWEGKIQSACVVWFHNEYPQYRGLLFHCPNQNDRKDSNAIQGAIRKSLGIIAGVSDLILLIQRGIYGALLIEMKDEHGKQSESQRIWQEKVEGQGYKYVLCRSLEEFQEIIRGYLNLEKKD